jgi:uncharacterized membrane protein YkoI
MKKRITIANITTALCLGLTVAFITGCATDDDEKGEKGEKSDNQAQLMSEAKVSKQDALATAQAQVPNGTVKEAELEREHGRLIWSFGFATPDTKDTTEVNINAIDGSLVNIEHESAESEANENKKEKDDDKD